MAIKPVTFQALKNFKSNLYALEIKSRFIDQTQANGYYLGYEDELEAIVSEASVIIKKGAFLIAGRMVEITTNQLVDLSSVLSGKVGYIIARAETYRVDDQNNVSLDFYSANSLDDIVLTQQDTYSASSENENKIYEIPLYSFGKSGNDIINLTRVIQPIKQFTEIKEQVDYATQMIEESEEIATEAQASASSAQASANEALRLVQQAVFEGGTVVKRNNTPLAELEISGIEGDIDNLQTTTNNLETTKVQTKTLASNISGVRIAETYVEDATIQVGDCIEFIVDCGIGTHNLKVLVASSSADASMVIPMGSFYYEEAQIGYLRCLVSKQYGTNRYNFIASIRKVDLTDFTASVSITIKTVKLLKNY